MLVIRLFVLISISGLLCWQELEADVAEYYIPVNEWEPSESLPVEWGGWQKGWRFFKRLELLDTAGVGRRDEAIEVDAEFHASQITDLAREIRVAEVESEQGPLTEVASQVYEIVHEDEAQQCRIAFLANVEPKAKKTYLIFYGNPTCHQPVYETDLKATGQDYALDIENKYYKVILAKSMGHLKGISFKQGSFGFTAGGPPMKGGHGVEGTLHWNPDWSDENTGRYRITNWLQPPHYSVVRGPICILINRWGNPTLALGPSVGQTRKVVISVSYAFFASVPYILMESRIDVLEDVRFSDCRNDEWLGIGMPEIAWMMKSGEIGFSTYAKGKSWSRQDPAWMTYFNRDTADGFASLHLEYECTHPHWSEPSSVGIGDNLWVRYPLENAIMRKGDYVREKNAYLVHRYEPPDPKHREEGFGMLMNYHRRLTQPLHQQANPVIKKPLNLTNVRDALRACYDLEVYVRGPARKSRRRLSLVDLGYVDDVRIIDGDVRIRLVMPYRGRETWFDSFADMARNEIQQRVDGVDRVVVQLASDARWGVNKMSSRARRRLGFLPDRD